MFLNATTGKNLYNPPSPRSSPKKFSIICLPLLLSPFSIRPGKSILN